MTAEVKEHIGEMRGMKVRWVDVIVAGHTVAGSVFRRCGSGGRPRAAIR